MNGCTQLMLFKIFMLFQRSEIMKRVSVASTNQAASAESLQHQTPSLENLLARSKIFSERIPEVVSDDIHEIQRTTGMSLYFYSSSLVIL